MLGFEGGVCGECGDVSFYPRPCRKTHGEVAIEAVGGGGAIFEENLLLLAPGRLPSLPNDEVIHGVVKGKH